MTELSRILCAVDFSEPAKAAFEHALALSHAQQAELTIVHAVPADTPFRRHARNRIATIAALRRAAEDRRVRLRVIVQHGDPTGVIVLHAKPYDLVVLGTHQRVGLERLRRGSVAERVAQRVACPVLVVPSIQRDSTQPAPGQFRNILTAIDFTPSSQSALTQALSTAQRSGAQLTALHVLEGVSADSRYGSHVMVPEYRYLRTRDAWRRLGAAIPAHAREAGTVRARVVIGKAGDEIIRVAEDIKTDLIVMGVTPRGAVGRWLFGSTATRVMRRADCPMLVVPERTYEALRPISEVDSTTPAVAYPAIRVGSLGSAACSLRTAPKSLL